MNDHWHTPVPTWTDEQLLDIPDDFTNVVAQHYVSARKTISDALEFMEDDAAYAFRTVDELRTELRDLRIILQGCGL